MEYFKYDESRLMICNLLSHLVMKHQSKTYYTTHRQKLLNIFSTNLHNSQNDQNKKIWQKVFIPGKMYGKIKNSKINVKVKCNNVCYIIFCHNIVLFLIKSQVFVNICFISANQ